MHNKHDLVKVISAINLLPCVQNFTRVVRFVSYCMLMTARLSVHAVTDSHGKSSCSTFLSQRYRCTLALMTMQKPVVNPLHPCLKRITVVGVVCLFVCLLLFCLFVCLFCFVFASVCQYCTPRQYILQFYSPTGT